VKLPLILMGISVALAVTAACEPTPEAKAQSDKKTQELRQQDIDEASIVCRGGNAYLIGHTWNSGRADSTHDSRQEFVVPFPGHNCGEGFETAPDLNNRP
jgi:hypothetical protein